MANPNDHSGPAFPGLEYWDEKPIGMKPGITRREWFAGKAIEGYVARYPDSCPANGGMRVAATRAYLLADCMVAAGDGASTFDAGKFLDAADSFKTAAVAAIAHLKECEAGRIAQPFKSTSLPLLEDALAKLSVLGGGI